MLNIKKALTELAEKLTAPTELHQATLASDVTGWVYYAQVGVHGDSAWHNKRGYAKRIKRRFSHGFAYSVESMDCGDYFSVCSSSRLFSNIKRRSTHGRFHNSCWDKGYSLCLLLLDGRIMTFIPGEGVMAC